MLGLSIMSSRFELLVPSPEARREWVVGDIGLRTASHEDQSVLCMRGVQCLTSRAPHSENGGRWAERLFPTWGSGYAHRVW